MVPTAIKTLGKMFFHVHELSEFSVSDVSGELADDELERRTDSDDVEAATRTSAGANANSGRVVPTGADSEVEGMMRPKLSFSAVPALKFEDTELPAGSVSAPGVAKDAALFSPRGSVKALVRLMIFSI
jgi:hypothetical protein